MIIRFRNVSPEWNNKRRFVSDFCRCGAERTLADDEYGFGRIAHVSGGNCIRTWLELLQEAEEIWNAMDS